MQDNPGGNTIPTQTFAEPESLAVPQLNMAGVDEAEMLLKKVGSEQELSGDVNYSVRQSQVRLFGRSIGQVFGIGAILLVVIIGVALAGVIQSTKGNKAGSGDGRQLLLSAGVIGNGKNGQQPLDDSVLQINSNSVITGGKSLTATGNVLIQSSVDSVDAFKIQNSAGMNILVADTLNNQVNIGNKPPGNVSLNVNGDITTNGALVSTTSGYSLSDQGLTIGGVLVCTARGCVSSSSPLPSPASPTIDVANLAYLNANQTFIGNNSFSGQNNFSGENRFNVTSTTAFQIQNSSATDNLFIVDTINNRIGIGTTPLAGGATLQIAGDLNVSSGVYKLGNVSGASFACPGGQVLQQATISGGIVTSGSCVTIAGGTTPTLQQVYDASIPASLSLSSASGVFQIQDSASPLATNLFEVTGAGGSTKYFAVNNLGISVTGNINTTGQYLINGSQINSTNLADTANLARLNGIQTFTGGNTFNNASNSFTGNGSGLSSLNASNVASGTLNDARLSANVTVQGNTFNGPSQLVQLTLGGILPVLSGANLTNLNAGAISSGTLSDTRLSANVALLNANQTFTGNDTFHLSSAALSVQDASTPLGTDLFTVTNSTGATKYFEVSATGVKINGNDACTSAGNCVGTGGNGAIGGGGTANTIPVFTGSGFTLGNSNLTQSGTTTTSNGNLNVIGQYQVSGSQISSSNLSDGANLAKLNANQTFTGANTFNNALNSFTGNGSALTSLNASNISSGTLNDARLSSNVALLSANQTFSGNNSFHLASTGFTIQDALTPLGTDLFAVTDNAGTTKYFSVSASGAKIGANDVCTSAGNCAGVGGGVTTAGGTTNKLAKFTAGQAIGDSIITDNGSIVTVGGTLSVNTISPTAALTIGVSGQSLTLQGDGTTKLSATASGITNSLVFAAPTVSNKTITVPDASGTIAVSASGPLALDAAGNLTCPTCLTSGGGGGTAGVSSFNTLTGAITLQGTANQISLGTVGNTLTLSTPQDIATTSTPTFANVNVGSGGQFRINGTSINTAGTLSNVAYLNQANTFTNTNAVQATSATTFQVQSASATETLFTVDSTARGAGGGNIVKVGNSTGSDTATTILVLDSTTANPTSNLAALNGGMFYNSSTGKVSIIENGVVKALCNQTDLSCGGNSTTLQNAYDNSSSPATITTSSVAKNIVFKAGATNDSTGLFQVQDSNGNQVARIDTVNRYVGINNSSPGAALDVTATGTYAGLFNGGKVGIGTSTPGATLETDGTALFKAATDSTSLFQIQNAAGTSNLFIADTTTNRLAIGQATATYKLDVAGDVNTTTGFRVGGTAGSTVTCSSGNVLQNATVSGGIITGGSCVGNGAGVAPTFLQVYANGASAADETATLNSTNGGIVIQDNISPIGASLFTVQSNGGSNKYLDVSSAGIAVTGNVNISGMYEVGGVQIATSNLSDNSNIAKLNANQTFTGNNTFSGTVLSRNTADTTAAFQIQNAVGTSNLFIADTTSTRIAIAQAAANYTLDVAGDINTTTGFRAGGTAGSGLTCSGGQVVQNAVVTGGIVTGGSCVANGAGATTTLQNAYDNSTSPATIVTSSVAKNIIIKSGVGFNSTGLLQVQNAAGGNLFNVDSTNSAITVGQGNLIVTGLGTPAAPVISAGSNQGGTLSGAAATTYFYKVTAINSVGNETLASSESSINGASFTPLTAPIALTAAANATAGNVSCNSSAGQGCKYEVTFVTANGETTGGTASSSVLTVTSKQIDLTNIPLGPTGTTSRKIYRSTNGGAFLLDQTIANNTATIATDNVLTPAGAIPASNTATTNTNNATVTFTPITGAASYRIYRGTTAGAESAYQTTATSPFTDTGAAGTTATTPTTSSVERVGIGTSTPTANLTVAGNALFKNSVNTTTAFQIQDALGASTLVADTTNRFVGINNANPNATLDVQASSSNFIDGFETGVLSPFVNGSNFVVGTGAAHTGSYSVNYSGTAGGSFSLTRTLGSVGTISFWAAIANSCAPTVTLSIDAANNTLAGPCAGTGIYTLFSFPVASGTHTFTWSITNGGGPSTMQVDDVVVTNTGAGTAALFNGGNVGIGTSFPNATLDVIGTSHFQASTDSTTLFQVQNAAGGNLFNIDSTNSAITVGQGNLLVTGLGTPAAPVITAGANTGGTLSGAGATTYFYKVTAINSAGNETLASSESSINGASFTKLSAPGAPTGVAIAGAAGLGIGNYRYKLTVITANGETTGGTESAVVTTTSGNQNVTVTLPAVPTGATGYKVYRTSVGGASGSEKLVNAGGCTGTIAATTCTDSATDAQLSATTPPVSNTATTNVNNATVTFTPITGAASYRIYRGTTAGAESAYQTTATSPFTDTGAAGTTATTPTTSSVERVGIGTSAPTANLDVRGTAFFKNGVDTTTAFQIQNAAGSSVINLDTTNRYLGINNLTPNSTLDVVAVAAPFYDGFESTLLTPFASTGASAVTITTNAAGTPHSGTYYAFSSVGGGIPNMTITKTFSSGGVITYWMKAQTNDVIGTNRFQFNVDGGNCNSVIATFGSWPGWAQQTCNVTAGTHLLNWTTNNSTMGVAVDDITMTNVSGSTSAATFNSGNVGIGTYFPNQTLGVSGTAHFQASTDSTSEFQIQNAAGSNALSVDTTSLNGFLTNTSFENSGISTWTYSGAAGGSVAQDATQHYLGADSLKVITGTTAAAFDGVKTTLNSTLAASTTHTISWYDKITSGSFTDVIARFSYDGSTANASNCSGINTQAVSTSGWTRHTCQFTTGSAGTAPTSSNAIFIVQQGSNGGVQRTFYIDAVQLEASTTATGYKETGLSFNGLINSAVVIQGVNNSTTAFAVQNTSGNSFIQVDTVGANLYLGNAGIASTIQIGNTTGAVSQTINIGNNATASSATTIVIGSTIGSSSVTIQSGSGSITFIGHHITGNSSGSTTVAAGAAANCAGSSPTVSISGNDTAGTVTITTDSTPACVAGTLSTITFAGAFGSAPRILLTPSGPNASTLQYYNNSSTTTTFTIDTNNAPAAATTYEYNYWVIQ